MSIDEPWRDYFIDIALLFLGAIITVFYVDIVINQHEAHRRVGPRAAAGHAVRRAATILIHSIAEKLPRENLIYKFQIPVWQTKADPLNAERMLYEDTEWIEHVANEVIPNESAIVERLTAQDIAELDARFESVFHALRETQLLYYADLEPELIDYIAYVLDNLKVEAQRLEYLKTPGLNQPQPSLHELLKRSLTIVEFINQNAVLPIPRAWTESTVETR
jgi:hypothetical protein